MNAIDYFYSFCQLIVVVLYCIPIQLNWLLLEFGINNNQIIFITIKISQMKKLNRTKLTPSTLNRSQQLIKVKPVLSQSNIPGSSALISTMKMELSSIKHDVQKLMNDDIQAQNSPEAYRNQIQIEECYKENQILKSKYQKLLDEVAISSSKNAELEAKIEELSRSKQQLQQEYSKLQIFKTKLQKQNTKAISKSDEQKQKLEQNIQKLKQQIQTIKQQSSANSQQGKWKEAWMQLSGQVTLLEEEVKQKQIEIESKDQQILQLGWELEDIKLNKPASNKLNKAQNEMRIELQSFREESKKRQKQRDEQRQMERSKQRQRDSERALQRQKEWERQKQRKIENQKQIQRANQRQMQKEKIKGLENNIQKLKQVIAQLTLQSQQDSNLRSKDIQSVITKNKQLQCEIQKLRNQSSEVKTNNFSLTSEKQRLEQMIKVQTEQLKKSSLLHSSEVSKYLDEISKLKTKQSEQQVLNLKLENSLTLNQSQGSNSVNFIKQTQLLHQINQKTTEIVALKSELEETKKSLNFLKNQNSTQRMKVYTGDRSVKNHFEIELINKKSELESMKRKMDALNKKVEARTAQLRQKDLFILNTIVNKVNREANQAQSEYIKKELEKHFSTTLATKLIEAESQIEGLKEEIQNNRLKIN